MFAFDYQTSSLFRSPLYSLIKVEHFYQESQNFLYNRLSTLGFDISKDQVYSSLGAARDLIRQRNLRPMLMLEPEALEVWQSKGGVENVWIIPRSLGLKTRFQIWQGFYTSPC